MNYTGQTLARHLALWLVIMTLPFWWQSGTRVWHWYHQHALFFILLNGSSLILGSLAHLIARRRWFLLRACQDCPAEPNFRPLCLYCKWASCSRCLAWWLALAWALGLSLVYWSRLWSVDTQPWANALVIAVFSGAGATLAAAQAIAVFFWQKR
ncbi:MAG: hypothetical protein KDK39_16475 [Leptospiraceae bacterium]|nr:hypothetical protein [Leptospiraceae bacterium]